MTVSRNGFPDCCGATILYNFDWTGPELGTFNPGHMYLAILSSEQEAYIPRLLKAKFRLLSDKVVNRNTGNTLFLYVRDIAPRTKAVRKRTFARR